MGAPPNAADLESELVCPVCETTLDQSSAPVAERMKLFIRERIAAGDTEQEIKDALVREFGPGVLAKPRDGGFGLLAWLLPLAVLLEAQRRRPSRPGVESPPAATPEAEEPLDPGSNASSTTSSRASTADVSPTSIPVSFLAGIVSFLAPCVLPLVPGYLSAISAVDADRLGEPGDARRVVVASIPFVLGFTTFFVLLGTGAALVGGRLLADQFLLERVAGFVLVVFGLALMGLLPWPERLLGAGCSRELGTAARGSCSAARSPSAPPRASVRSSRRRSSCRLVRQRRGGCRAPRLLLARARGAVRARGRRVLARHGRVPLGPTTTTASSRSWEAR